MLLQNIHKDFLSKDLICELETGFVFLEDNSCFPWIILVYKKNVKNMLELTTQERLDLMRDIEKCEKVIDELYSPFQTNIAMLGNQTPHLHVHIIARQKDDACFPKPVFGLNSKLYEVEEKKTAIKNIKNLFLTRFA